MRKIWKLQKAYPKSLNKEFTDFDELARQLFFNRGVKTAEEARRFLNPDYDRDLRDPFLIKNMDRAADRILSAINKNEKIIIYGDYDADGVCSSAILASFFKSAGYENAEIYIPDLAKYGHGLNEKALEDIFKKKTGLVITIDNGISNYEEIEKLEKGGVNVIVLDHHIVPEKIPPASVIVDPRQKGETYPFRDFSASGLAFKVVSAILKKNSFGLVSGWGKWLLDMAAIGTVADLVSLRDENRVLVYWGLEVLKKTRRLGLYALAKKAGLNLSKITAEDISFYLAPRINVAGRLDHATLSGELLLTSSREEAEWLSGRLEELTAERKELTERITREIRESFSSKNIPEIIVMGNKEWSSGVLGAASSRISESFSRTAVLWGRGNAEKIKGSARSAGDVNVRDLLMQAGVEMYHDFGGHPMAAGFTLKEEYADKFEKRISDVFSKMSKEKNVLNELLLEKELSLDEADEKTLEAISRFEPFGQDNPKPVFIFKNLLVEGVRNFGNDGVHLEFRFKNSGNQIIPAIGFWTSNHIDPVNNGDRIDLAASLEISTFRGYDELRLRIVDFKKV